MPIRIISMNPWNRSLWVGLALGVCLFQPFIPFKAFALEPNSPLFEQNKSTSPGNEKQNLPMPLSEESPNPSPGIFSSLFRLFLGLSITVGLIFVTVWGLKIIWEKRGWNSMAEEGKPIKVLTSTYLAPRKTIHLIEVGKRILVVGVGNDDMSCLDVIRDPEEVELLRQATQQGFPKVFKRIIQKNEAAQQELEAKKMVEESTQAVGSYIDKLKQVSKKKKTKVDMTDEGL